MFREKEPEADERQVVDDVACVDDAFGELLEMTAHGKIGNEAGGPSSPALRDLDEVQKQEQIESEKPGYDLVLRQAAEEQHSDAGTTFQEQAVR